MRRYYDSQIDVEIDTAGGALCVTNISNKCVHEVAECAQCDRDQLGRAGQANVVITSGVEVRRTGQSQCEMWTCMMVSIACNSLSHNVLTPLSGCKGH